MNPGDESLLGTTIGAYRIVSLLGIGGMGAVYRAEQAPLGRPVALKLIHDRLAQDPGMAARFLREAKIASQLRNPNTVTLYDFGQAADGRLYMAMELLEGESLSDRLEREGTLDVDDVVAIGLQICRSLTEAHHKAIVHRDLKTENVFLTTSDDGSLLVKVLDYGIAYAGAVAASALEPASLTQHGMVVGTPSYMSPEQARAEPVDGRSDLFSLGVILFELLTGVCPWKGESPLATLGKLLVDPPPPMATVGARKKPPPAIESLVRSLLEKERDARPATAMAVQSRLRLALEPAAPSSVSDTAELGGQWGLPSELQKSTAPARHELETVAVRAATPPAIEPPAPAEPPRPTTPPRPAAPPVSIAIDPDASPFELDVSPPRLEVDRRPRADLGVPLVVQRHSSMPPRPRPSRAPVQPQSGGGTWVVALVVLGALGAAGWWVRGRAAHDDDTPADAGAAEVAPAPIAPAPAELPLSLAALSREEDALRALGLAQAALPVGGWTGTYDLDGGMLRVFEEDGRVTGTFESALRAGQVQGTLSADGVLDFDWRSTDSGAVRGTQVRTGRGVLRSWSGRSGKRLLGTWGFGESRDGAIWLAVPRAPPGATGKRRGR